MGVVNTPVVHVPTTRKNAAVPVMFALVYSESENTFSALVESMKFSSK